MRRKPGPKSKTRYYTDHEAPKKPKHSDEITGSFALDQIIADSLTETNNYNNHTPTDYSKKKSNSGGGDVIQSVMENLNLLQKMSMPIESETSATSSPVSVIAFNKNYSPKTATAGNSSSSASQVPKGDYSKADFCTGFQDAFQKQLIGEVPVKTESVAPSAVTVKNNYNR